MSIIKQKGAPTRSTKGSVGEVYVDLNTGNRYECTFAYQSAGSAEYGWKLVKDGSNKKETVKEVAPEVKTPVVEEPIVEEVKEEVVEPAVDLEPEQEPVAPQPQRTNYTQYSKKTK